MSRKRRNTSSPEASPPPDRKRHVSLVPSVDSDFEDPQISKEKPQLNQTVGQTGAFPGLGADDDEPFYGPAGNGIDYLRMVRSEARNVPSLLVAPSDPTADNTIEEEGEGYWEDGAYTAVPSKTTKEATRLTIPQVRYYESLLAHFRLLQTTLRCTPPLHTVQGLDPVRPISFPPGSTNAYNQWKQHVQETEPNIVQLACMDVDSTWELLKLLGDTLGDEDEQSASIGAWLWAGLARCPDLGTLVSEEVAELRALANIAAKSLQAGENLDEDHNRILAVTMEHDLGIGAAISQRMILDMVLTVVGEVYGQRDLLEYREVWESSAD